jgi:hypothetical protein
MKAYRALETVKTFIKPKVPSAVELNVLEPCSQCHGLPEFFITYKDWCLHWCLHHFNFLHS